MKAIVYHEYGSPDVLELKDIDKPLVKDNEVLVRVHAASVNRLDWHLMGGSPYIVSRGRCQSYLLPATCAIYPT